MSPGTRRRVASPEALPAARPGGCTFAEHPDLRAPEARIIWRADFDPATLPVSIAPCSGLDEDGIDVACLTPWLRAATGAMGLEYAVLTDGRRHLRLDILEGSLAGSQGMILLRYEMWGSKTAARRLRTLERFLDLARTGRFRPALYPPDPVVGRGVALLRVHDARASGASHRDIGEILFGTQAVASGWEGRTDHVRQRVRRMVKSARAMAQGGYRSLMRSR
ncbi:MAG TPA: DUF2285 domain-containing protein [Sphingobium sp.]|nr:DUF2285 domain-containing protein [Sphingobium sp.]